MHFIKEKLRASLICTPYVKTQVQFAAIMTKEVSSSGFSYDLKQVRHARYLCVNLSGSVDVLFYVSFIIIILGGVYVLLQYAATVNNTLAGGES